MSSPFIIEAGDESYRIKENTVNNPNKLDFSLNQEGRIHLSALRPNNNWNLF
jgi:hypothetical protein